MTRLISFAALIIIIVVIGFLFYNVMVGFFVPVFLAAVLAVVFRPLHRWVLEKVGHREKLAAGITTLLIMTSVHLPFAVVLMMASIQGLQAITEVSPSSIRIGVSKLRDSLGLRMEYEVELRAAQQEVDAILAKANESAFLSMDEADLQRMRVVTLRALSELRRVVTGSSTVSPVIADPSISPVPPDVPTVDSGGTVIANGGVPQTSADQAGITADTERPPSPGRYEPQFDRLFTLANEMGQPVDDELVFQQQAVALSQEFNKLKNEILGGAYLALAKEAANPTGRQIKTLTEQTLDYLRPKLLSLTGATGSLFVRLVFGSVILVVTLFFFLSDGRAMLNNVMFLSPLDDRYEQELLLEFDRISRAVVIATIMSAVVQGLTAGVGYYFAGMPNLPLLVMLTTLFALVPFVGPAVIWVPVCCYLAFYEERTLAAILLACWGVLVVGTIDNVVKAFVLHGQSQLHPLLALLSVLGGVRALGPIGIVVGPMAVAMLQTLLSILQRELLHFEEHRDEIFRSSKAKTAMDETPGKESAIQPSIGSTAVNESLSHSKSSADHPPVETPAAQG